jgi:DNA-binding HxlR family transcriptional regulator
MKSRQYTVVYHYASVYHKTSLMQRNLSGITPKMLVKELRDLEINDLVTRREIHANSLTVEYSLTDYGKSLDDVIYCAKIIHDLFAIKTLREILIS